MSNYVLIIVGCNPTFRTERHIPGSESEITSRFLAVMIAERLPPQLIGRKLFTLGRELFLIPLFGIKLVPDF